MKTPRPLPAARCAGRAGLTSRDGFGIIELLASMALFAVLAAAGLPHIDTRRHDINVSLRRIGADMRWARARAIGTGAHHTLRVTGPNTYQIERLQLVAGNWQVAEVVRDIELPWTLAIVDFTPPAIEFDTRGTVVFAAATPPAPWLPRLVDSSFDAERAFAIWPSGQFHELQ